MPRKFSGERMIFSIYGTRTQVHPSAKMKLKHFLTPLIKIHTRWKRKSVGKYKWIMTFKEQNNNVFPMFK